MGTAVGTLPSASLLGLFTTGALLARSAGCVINDLTDQDIDVHVERTKARPLTTGELSRNQALGFLAALMGGSFGVLFSLPSQCVYYGLLVTPVVFIYPTMKRYFPVPQLGLGICFNSGTFIGFAAASASHVVNWNVVLNLNSINNRFSTSVLRWSLLDYFL